MEATASHPIGGIDEQSEHRLIWLMAGRLVLALVSLVIAAGLDGLGRDLSDEARSGIYWTVTFAFFAAVISGSYLSRIRNPLQFSAVQIAMDIAIVTSLVHFSGGQESVYSFLYVLVILYSALLFKRQVALAAASFSALAYGIALISANSGWALGEGGGGSHLAWSYLLALWCVHGGALFLVGALASVLSGELQRTGAALDRSTSDLRQLRDIHQRTVEGIMSGLLTTDAEGRITSFNPEAGRITGLRMEEVLGRDLEDVIPGASAVIEETIGRPSEAAARIRLPFRNMQGKDLHLGLAGSVLRDGDGTNLGDIVIFQDVTRVVAMETDLRRSERLAAVGELSAKIAHEIRNPLASISGSIEILRTDLDDEKPGVERGRLMGIVMRETDRLNALITDFLLYARPAPMTREVVDLEALIREIGKMLESVCPEDIRLELDVVDGISVKADSGQLRQVLWNLCLNGIQSMEKGGSLLISARPLLQEFAQGGTWSLRNGEGGIGDGGWVELIVGDTGPGIPIDAQERIFEPFFTTKKEGTGLGLSTVHRIVENHGGELQLESDLGVGTTFRIRLPGREV